MAALRSCVICIAPTAATIRLVFILQNQELVRVWYLGVSASLPLGVGLFIAAVDRSHFPWGLRRRARVIAPACGTVSRYRARSAEVAGA